MNKKNMLLVLFCFCLMSFSQQSSYSELYGYVKSIDDRPIKGVSLRISGYSVSTDEKGYYKFSSLRNKRYVISVSPPQKQTKYFRIEVNGNTRKNWKVNW